TKCFFLYCIIGFMTIDMSFTIQQLVLKRSEVLGERKEQYVITVMCYLELFLYFAIVILYAFVLVVIDCLGCIVVLIYSETNLYVCYIAIEWTVTWNSYRAWIYKWDDHTSCV